MSDDISPPNMNEEIGSANGDEALFTPTFQPTPYRDRDIRRVLIDFSTPMKDPITETRKELEVNSKIVTPIVRNDANMRQGIMTLEKDVHSSLATVALPSSHSNKKAVVDSMDYPNVANDLKRTKLNSDVCEEGFKSKKIENFQNFGTSSDVVDKAILEEGDIM